MKNRRTFIRQTGTLTLSAILLKDVSWAAQNSNKFGLQLYSIKEDMENDPKATLKQIAAIGYKELESFAGNKGMYWGMKAKEFQTYVKGLGMNLSSTHFGGSNVLEDESAWKKIVDEAAEAGVKNLVCSFISSPKELGEVGGYKHAAKLFNKGGEISKKAGIQISYHNHEGGFAKVEGEIPYDVLLKETDSKFVAMEMDIYWVVKAGADPIAYFNKYPGRFPLWHVKDMDKTNREINSDVGKGSIDFIKIFKHAKQAGLKYPYIEQENFTGKVIDSLKNDFNYIQKISY